MELLSPLSQFERLRAEEHRGGSATEVEVDSSVAWRADGEMRPAASGGAPSAWLHLVADTKINLTCQRCLGPVTTALRVDNWFRFVADEATAEAQDDDCEEDLLALEPRPDLHVVLEDELLMALPIVPMHETCPHPVPMQAADPSVPEEAEEPRRNPFAALAKLKK